MFLSNFRIGSIRLVDRIGSFTTAMFRVKCRAITVAAIYVNLCLINGFCHVRNELKRMRPSVNGAADFERSCEQFEGRIYVFLKLFPEELS